MTAPPPLPPVPKSRLGLILALVIGSLVITTIFTGIWALKSSTKPRPAARETNMPVTEAKLARYYDQKLDWQPCGNGNDCADLTVPLDYRRPADQTITVSVLKVPSTDSAIGALVVNPGGPGGSGIQYAASGQWPAEITDAYDIVGFDPRGVGKSTPIKCLNTQQMDDFVASDPDPDTRVERRQLDAAVRGFGEGCLTKSGNLVRHISTEEVARDLDVLRQVLGQSKLDYFGASYGTLIGATYANMFPTHVGRMVLDGAVDPSLSNTQLALEQAAAFETALQAYLADCVKRKHCVLGTSVTAASARLRQFFSDVEANPLRTDSDRQLEVGNAYLGVWLPLYVKDYWPMLSRALTQAIDEGDGTQLLSLADMYVSRGPSGYSDNSMEALYAVNCLDHSDTIPTKQVPSHYAEFEKASPTFGRAFAYSLSTCSAWPVKSGKSTTAMSAAGAPPIVVVGTTRDPATPLKWAQALADQLDSGVLITRDGDGHTGYTQGNQCVDDAVNAFLVDDVVPKPGLKC